MWLLILLTISLAIRIHAMEIENQETLPPRPFSNDVPLKNDVDIIKKPEGRIFNGKSARPKEIPYQAGLLIQENQNSRYQIWCGGTLISNQHILSAAHCFMIGSGNKIVSLVKVYLGLVNKLDPSEKGRQEIIVNKNGIIVHENYKKQEISNDISIIKLPKQIQCNQYIQPARLPKRGQNNLVGAIIIASGWGNMGDIKRKTAHILQYTKLKIISGQKCENVFKNYDDKRQICAEGHNTGTCQGDSGGPHVISNSKEGKIIVGITSYGFQYCEYNIPEVMTRVSYYLDWIQKVTGLQV